MKKDPETEKEVAWILAQMRKALPKIKRQAEVYEQNKAAVSLRKSPKITVHSRNV